MFGALSAHPGLGVTGLNAKLPPRSSLPGIGSPFSLTGEWQSPQRATCSTKYLPRSICADLSCSAEEPGADRKSTRLNSSHQIISYAVFCLKKNNHLRAEVPRNARYDRARHFVLDDDGRARHLVLPGECIQHDMIQLRGNLVAVYHSPVPAL